MDHADGTESPERMVSGHVQEAEGAPRIAICNGSHRAEMKSSSSRQPGLAVHERDLK